MTFQFCAQHSHKPKHFGVSAAQSSLVRYPDSRLHEHFGVSAAPKHFSSLRSIQTYHIPERLGCLLRQALVTVHSFAQHLLQLKHHSPKMGPVW